ncbi:MAG: transglycosylase domain-containing protein, partial [Myxococcota bacterium]|nr:transglycosylase domain-containing protein [Myxococcota bacterium]
MVGGVLYRQATSDVSRVLEEAVWSESAQVLSGPLEIWPGLTLTLEELIHDLQVAGYSRVDSLGQPGDFVVMEGQVRLRDDEGEFSVHLAGGRVSRVDPGPVIELRPVELAAIRVDQGDRRTVFLDQTPVHLQRAILAVEDSRFYEHPGVDPRGIARAILVNVWRGHRAQGGSTLTQQLAKNLFLSTERTWTRKVREALFAFALEQRLSKPEILELYLNAIYLGQVGGRPAWGVEEAARMYFGKSVSRLDLGESATLAGIIAAPNGRSPVRHPEVARERRDVVLERMKELGWADPAEVEKILSTPTPVTAVAGGRSSPWLLDAALDRVEAELGAEAVERGGWSIRTTVHPALQRLAERAVAEGLGELGDD